MSRIDENGTVHPTDEDPWSIGAQAHFAYCKECNPYALDDELLREAKAEAWQEGHDTGWNDGIDGSGSTPNPYSDDTTP